jgi:hypothetical protein
MGAELGLLQNLEVFKNTVLRIIFVLSVGKVIGAGKNYIVLLLG